VQNRSSAQAIERSVAAYVEGAVMAPSKADIRKLKHLEHCVMDQLFSVSTGATP